MRFNGQSLFAPGQIFGTTTNDNAAAGKVGQIIESTVLVGAPVALTTGNPFDVTSISLTAGDWDAWGLVSFSPNGATTITAVAGWISATSAAVPTAPNAGAYNLLAAAFINGTQTHLPVGMRRFSLAATTTIYLSGLSNFGVSTQAIYGYIGARRVR